MSAHDHDPEWYNLKRQVKIPGLIEDKNPKMTQDETQAMREKFAKQQKIQAQIQSEIPDSMTSTYHMTPAQIEEQFGIKVNNQYTVPGGTGGEFKYNQPYIINQPSPYQNPYDIEKFQKKITPQSTEEFKFSLLEYMKRKKSAFEEILDMLFTTAEKEQFLIDIGYFFENDPLNNAAIIKRKLSTGEVKTVTNSLDDLFLKEITVKFKNLLLAKATLKLKL